MEKGLELNPHERYAANKLVDGKKYTLVWYLDDNKVSNMEVELVEDSIKYLKKHFGELVVTRGKKHIIWCTNINITEDIF